jgi:hypothetical protein
MHVAIFEEHRSWPPNDRVAAAPIGRKDGIVHTIPARPLTRAERAEGTLLTLSRRSADQDRDEGAWGSRLYRTHVE